MGKAKAKTPRQKVQADLKRKIAAKGRAKTRAIVDDSAPPKPKRARKTKAHTQAPNDVVSVTITGPGLGGDRRINFEHSADSAAGPETQQATVPPAPQNSGGAGSKNPHYGTVADHTVGKRRVVTCPACDGETVTASTGTCRCSHCRKVLRLPEYVDGRTA